MRWTGGKSEVARLKKHVRELEKKAVDEVIYAAVDIMDFAMANTPVWMGETVRNYRWGKNGNVPSARLSGLGSGPPGPTNSMPLGAEPRRAPNEADAVSAMFKVLSQKKLASYVLTNTCDPGKWDLIDNGAAPTKDNSRIPGGLSKRIIQVAADRPNWRRR